MKYIEVDVIEDATHWLALENPYNIKGDFAYGKYYKLEIRRLGFIDWDKNVIEKDYWVKDNNSEWHQPFALHNGKFVKVLI
jgi:hypothetical protein